MTPYKDMVKDWIIAALPYVVGAAIIVWVLSL